MLASCYEDLHEEDIQEHTENVHHRIVDILNSNFTNLLTQSSNNQVPE